MGIRNIIACQPLKGSEINAHMISPNFSNEKKITGLKNFVEVKKGDLGKRLDIQA